MCVLGGGGGGGGGGVLPVANHKDSGMSRFSTLSQTWTFPVNKIINKVPKCSKYMTNLCNFFKFVLCLEYFKSSFH